MKRIIFLIMTLISLVSVSFGGLTNSSDAIKPGSSIFTTNAPGNPLTLFCAEVETEIEAATLEGGLLHTFSVYGGTFGQSANNVFTWTEVPSASENLSLTFAANAATFSTSSDVVLSFGTLIPNLDGLDVDSYIYLNPLGSAPATTEGYLYANTDHQLYYYDGTGWRDLTASATGVANLDEAYDAAGAGAGYAIDVDSGPVTLSNNDDDIGYLLYISQAPATGAAAGGLSVALSATSTGYGIGIANSGSGSDIVAGGGAFTVSKTAAVSALSVAATTGTFTNLYQTQIAAAASGNTNLNIDAGLLGSGQIILGASSTGKITTDNAVELFGNTAIGNSTSDELTFAGKFVSNLTMDDDTTDSPSLILRDAGEATCTITKLNGANANTTITTSSATAKVQILTGNLKVGDGTETVTLNGDDGYITGTLEVASTTKLAGTLTTAGITAVGTVSVNDTASTNTTSIGAGTTTGTITIGGTGTQAIDVGAGAGAKAVTIGSVTGASATTILSGSGNLAINSAAALAATTTIGGNSATGTVTLGGTGTQAIDVGTGAGIKTVTVGSTNTSSATTIQSGTGKLALTSTGTGGDAMSLGTSAGGMDFTIAGAAADEDMDFLTNSSFNFTSTEAVANQFYLQANGVVAGNAVNIVTANGAIALAAAGAANGNVSITAGHDITVNPGAAAGIVNIGTNTHGNFINIGTDNTAADAIAIGSALDTSSLAGISVTVGSTGTTSTTILQSGSGAVSINASNNQPTNIATGSTTSTVAIGNAAAGAITVDTAAGFSLDGATASNVTCSGADLTVSSTTKSVVISGGEAVADAIQLTTGAGGVLVTTTGAMADQFKVSAVGSIAGNAINLATTDGGIVLTAAGATKGDMLLTVGDALTANVTGATAITTSTFSLASTTGLDISAAGALSNITTAIASVGVQSTATAVTATDDGTGTGIIPSNTSFVVAASGADANHQIKLPVCIVGMQMTIVTDATGCELICTTAGDKINNIVCGGTNEAALIAETVYKLTCVSATEWIMVGYDHLGAHLAPTAPDSL